MLVSQNYGYLSGGPHNKDYSILGLLILENYHIDPLYTVVYWRIARSKCFDQVDVSITDLKGLRDTPIIVPI